VDYVTDAFDIYIQSPQADVNAMAENWLKEKAKEVLVCKTAEWAQKMGVEYNNIVVKDQQTLWASCSAKKNINYTYRIIKMPEAIRDYLIVHELSHLVHMNHGTEYWQLVAQFCPEYKTSRKWLNDNKGAIFADLNLKYIAQEENRQETEREEKEESVPQNQDQ